VNLRTLDLNCDVGEGFGRWSVADDDALLSVVTSANVACGYHAGDATTMRRACDRAAQNDVAIGAHIGYRDLSGFGRRFIAVPGEVLVDEVLHQLAALDGFARVAGGAVRYVKAHGALAHATIAPGEQAEAVVSAIVAFGGGLRVLGLPGAALMELARAVELTTVREAFPDRAYTPAGALVPRQRLGAVLVDPEIVAARAVRMACDGTVEAVDGSEVTLDLESLCVHGDTPGALLIARRVRRALLGAGVRLRPFSPPPQMGAPA
jgi:UPF0271 protein